MEKKIPKLNESNFRGETESISSEAPMLFEAPGKAKAKNLDCKRANSTSVLLMLQYQFRF